MSQIKISNLEALIKTINLVTKSPETPYTRNKDGTSTRNPGNYHLDGAYGGWKLDRILESGGVHNVLECGFETKKHLYELMQAYLRGLTCNNT